MLTWPPHLPLLRSLGLCIRAEQGKLFASPREKLDADVRDHLRLFKREILQELASEEADRLYATSKEIWP